MESLSNIDRIGKQKQKIKGFTHFIHKKSNNLNKDRVCSLYDIKLTISYD